MIKHGCETAVDIGSEEKVLLSAKKYGYFCQDGGHAQSYMNRAVVAVFS